jgi:type IV secretory pathway VirD2 relaxase
VHVIVRGKADDGQDLVISRDYMSAAGLVALPIRDP